MPLDFSDLIPKPPPGGISFDDLIPQRSETASTSAPPPAPDADTRQPQLAADVNALGQGVVSGTGAAIAGVGRGTMAAAAQGTQRQLAVMDAIDQGHDVPQDQDVIGYQFLSPEQRAKARADFTAADAELAKREPNAAVRVGTAIEAAAPGMFPVAAKNEGIQTGVGRMIGGAVPALVAGAVGGPVGVLGSLAVIGSQAYDGAYQDAIAKGATPEAAEDAAGKSAVTQAITMVTPLGRLLQRVPVPLRDGLMKTLFNMGQHGVEFGSANALGTFANNYVAQQTYDPGRSLTAGTGDAALEGTIAGLVIRGGAVGARMARGAVTTQPSDAVAAIGSAPDIDGAIAAAGKAASTPVEVPQIEAPQPSFGDLFAQAGPPVPQSAGAAASREGTAPGVADLSTADMKANRRRAEMDELLAPPQANDKTIYVNGSLPTLAEMSADPVVSQYENLLRERNAGAFVGEGKRLTENNKARVNEYDANTVSDPTLNTMRRDREDRWIAAANDILPNARKADLTAALDWVQEQLSDPMIQENDAVRSVLEDFHERLVDDKGNLKTNPAAVWGIHNNLQNQLAKAKDPLNMTGAEKFAEGQIITAKGLIDQAMNVATDGRFGSALANYAEDSKAINSGVLLNDFRPKLTNMAGELQAANFHRFVVSLAKERGDPGIDPSMDISDQTMRSLINIDTDLKRAGLIRLGSARGSPTNLLGALAEQAGLDAAHSIAGQVPYVGGLISAVPKYLAQRKMIADTVKHLAEPEGGYTYPEPEPPEGPVAPTKPPGGGGPGGASGAGPLFAEPPAPPPEPAAPPPATRTEVAQSPATTGAGPGESIAFTPSGAPVAVRYTVRDASDLIASQLADGRTNPAYPAALQPRDRTRAASIQQINSIANRLQPERLGTSASTSEGAPIIGPDGAVESGNGRTLAIMQAYADGGPLADAYRKWVSSQGYDTSRMQNPVLVRERIGDLDMPARARLAADMGASPIAAMSAPERAAADARAIPTDILSMYQGGDVTLAKNAPFARAFAEHVIPPSERASFMTADGDMSADGALRMRNALTQHAYGSNSLVTSLAENADPDIKAFGGALVDAAGDMAKLRGAIDSGAVSRASDIAPDIVAAAQLIQTARRQRISLADAVGQRDAFSVLPEKTEDILQAAFGENYAGRMSRARMADLLSAFAQEAQMQSGLFGANMTSGEMLAEARAKYGYGTKTSRSGVSVGNGPGLDFNRP
jgi:hypothetical protein